MLMSSSIFAGMAHGMDVPRNLGQWGLEFTANSPPVRYIFRLGS